MLSEEQTFFIGMLSDCLAGRATEKDPSDIKDALIECAARQGLEGMLYSQCPDILSPLELRRFSVMNVYGYAGRTEYLNEIKSEFSKCGIDFVPFKGADICRLYPNPKLRTMSDMDILIREEDRDRAHEALLRIGSTCDFKLEANDMEWGYSKNHHNVEIHTRLLYEEAANRPEHVRFTDRAWDYAIPDGEVPHMFRLDMSFHLVYTLLHLRKHFVSEGVGFRPFADLAVMFASGETEPVKISEMLRETGLDGFARVCFGFCNRWFGTGFPEYTEPDDAFFEESTSRIFSISSAGEDGDTDELRRTNMITMHDEDRFYKLRHAFGIAFPGYSRLCRTEDYNFVEGRPWLVPIAWVYRFFFGIFHRRGKYAVKSAAAMYTVDPDNFKKLSSYLRKWEV